MNRATRIGLAAVVAVCATAGLAAASPAGHQGRPHPVNVGSGPHSVRAALGSYCVNGPHVGQCADSFYPLETKGRLPVTIGQSRLKLRMHDSEIRSVRLQLLRAHGKHFDSVGKGFGAELQKGHPNRWTAQLPHTTGRANRLDIAVKYKHHIGDADYWAGLKVLSVR